MSAAAGHPYDLAMLSAPLAPALDVSAARDAYLAENGFSVDEYDAPRGKATVFGVDITVPNPPDRARAIRFHDLHHVATGYGTDPVGEAEISAWELGAGLRGIGRYVRTIVTAGMALGLVLAPMRTLRAFRHGRRGRSLWSPGSEYEPLLALSVADLRATMGIPVGGLADRPRRLHDRAPAAVVPLASN